MHFSNPACYKAGFCTLSYKFYISNPCQNWGNKAVAKFLSLVNLDTLIRIPDSYSSVDDTGEADLAFRVNISTGAPVIVGILLEHKSGRDSLPFRGAFVNTADIPDIDCFECEDVAVGMGAEAMKYAFDGEKLVKDLPNFKDALIQMQ